MTTSDELRDIAQWIPSHLAAKVLQIVDGLEAAPVAPAEPTAIDAIYAAWHGAGVDIAGGNWRRFVGMLPPLYTNPAPVAPALVPGDVEKNAARYLWLRNEPPLSLSVRRFPGETPRGCYLDGYNLDAAIDAAMSIK